MCPTWPAPWLQHIGMVVTYIMMPLAIKGNYLENSHEARERKAELEFGALQWCSYFGSVCFFSGGVAVKQSDCVTLPVEADEHFADVKMQNQTAVT